MNKATLENWSVRLGGDMWQAPEARPRLITGDVYGHPNFADGERINISLAVKVDRISRTITTRQTEYTLGLIDAEYALAIPNAEERFWNAVEKGMAMVGGEV